MTNGEFMDMVINDLKAYHKADPMASVKRNIHMSDYYGQPVAPQTVDALLVDFVNFIGMRRGMDLGLYTRDLRPSEITEGDS